MLFWFSHTFVRLLIGLITLLVYMKILGKMQLAPQSAIDQIGNYVLGGIIGGIIYNIELPLWQFFMAMIIWGSLMLGVKYLEMCSLRAKRAIQGKPILLMQDGELETTEFIKAKISADDLMSRLHQQGIATISDLNTIWLESNGQLTLVRKDDERLAWVLIEDGQFNEIDLRLAGVSKDWVKQELTKKGYHSVSEIFIAELVRGEFIAYPYETVHPI